MAATDAPVVGSGRLPELPAISRWLQIYLDIVSALVYLELYVMQGNGRFET